MTDEILEVVLLAVLVLALLDLCKPDLICPQELARFSVLVELDKKRGV